MTRHPRSRRFVAALASIFLLAPMAVILTANTAQAGPPKAAPAAAEDTPGATSFRFYKFPVGQLPGVGEESCTGIGLNVTTAPFYSTDDCGFGLFTLTGTTAAPTVQLIAEGETTPFATPEVVADDVAGDWQVTLTPADTWPSGAVTLRVKSGDAVAGQTTIGHNLLGATFDPAPSPYDTGEDIPVTGTISQLDSTSNTPSLTGVAAEFTLEVTDPSGAVLNTQPVTAAADGTFSATVPGADTADVEAGPDRGFRTELALSALDATYDDAGTPWAALKAGSGSVTVLSPATELLLENSFVSSVGWVKPGDTYPSRLILKNPTDQAFTDVSVTVPSPDGATFTDSRSSVGTESIAAGTVTWTIPSVSAATESGPSVVTLVLESEADTLAEDAQLVWKNLSSTATLTATGSDGLTATSHGPKVIPESDTYDTARYGDRPFPVVPVDYLDRKHQDTHSGGQLAEVINSPTKAGSTFNLFQEMSLGQLFPNGTVPSADIASADFEYAEGFPFTELAPAGTCHGATLPETAGTPLYPERIQDGFYQLPGTTDYYGDDKYGSAVVGGQVNGALQDIDSACGPVGKLVFDSAAIADPEIDYSDYDTDKDGVVDFFMVVFAGCGGNGVSQIPTSCPYSTESYDNIWPHSSSLEFYYTDPDTGLAGFETDDQLKDNEDRPLFYEDTTYTTMTTDDTGIPVKVRIGPYNVNPETAIDKASVISHEYGHSLGLPDFYSTTGRETYGDWNLMATDKSQNMDVFSRQEMGWVVPQVLEPGQTTDVEGWTDSKEDTHSITWQTEDGTPYELTGPDVHNAEAYVAKLPGRQLIDPSKFETGDTATLSHAWWSGSGNDFGCAPSGGHNLDVAIPGLADLPEGSTINLQFKSLFDIEWDYDYGYVLTSTDGGESYTSHASEEGTTTTTNQNTNTCQQTYSNGITGSSGSYAAGTEALDRVTDTYPESVFLADSFDISDLAGAEAGVLRFSYATDPGLARPGWFIDDLLVTATTPDGDTVLLDTDLEGEGGPQDGRFYNGGCKEDLTVATSCTKGWNYIDSSADSPQDHAYYLEMRDRSGFDFDSQDQNDRDDLAFLPGLSLVYTDEAHGYGNAGTDSPPAQSPLDSQPDPGNDTPDLNDAAFTATAGDSSFTDSGEGHTDNYTDPAQGDVDERYPDVENPWRFQYDCLSFDVLAMTGQDVGPENADGNLTGDVTFDLGAGCGEFDYGYVDGGGEPGENTAPVAKAKVTPKKIMKNKPVILDARGSTDTESSDQDLDYSWDFGDGGSIKDASGSVVNAKWKRAGFYNAEVTVTDPEGMTDTEAVRIRVGRFVDCVTGRVERDGGWRVSKSGQARGGKYCDSLGKQKGKQKGRDVLKLSFTGPRLAMTYGKAKQGGSGTVYVDGKRRGTVSFRAATKKIQWGKYRTFGRLGEGSHTARLVITKKAGFVDDFVIFGPPGKK